MPSDASRPEPVSLGEHNGFDIYPMPMFLTLAVPEVEMSAAWYQKALGFGTMFTPGAPLGAITEWVDEHVPDRV